MSFLKTKVSFPSNVSSIFSAMRQNSNTLLLAQILYTKKGSPLSTNLWDFWVLWSKLVKLILSILNWQVNSSSNLVSFCIVMTQNSPVNFELINFLLWIKGSHQSPNFQTFESALMKICSIPYVIFESISQFYFKCCINIQCHQT